MDAQVRRVAATLRQGRRGPRPPRIDPVRVSRGFSIFAAAEERGEAIGLVTDRRTYSWNELAALTRARMAALDATESSAPIPVIGANDVDTVVTLYALFERRVPALLLHPRLTGPERDALLQAAAEAGALPRSDVAAVLYTSGTTGAPRAALLTHTALHASALASEANLGWKESDCWMLCMPLAHVGGLSILTRCLMARRAVALVPGFDEKRFPALVARLGVTLVSLVPTMLARILDAHPRWTVPPSLRAILLGGAPASVHLLERAQARGLPVLVTYGMTETCSQVTTTPYALRFAPAAHGVGLPLPGIDARVRDGVIEVRGPVLMAGYWTEPSLEPNAWFATGDLGAIDEAGCLHVYARRHDLIVTGGENVYPVEVESVLEACPGVNAAGVFPIADETWGQIVAAVMVGDPAVATDGAVREHIVSRLAPHKHPRRIAFVEKLPHTRAGKLDRAALAQLATHVRPFATRDAR